MRMRFRFLMGAVAAALILQAATAWGQTVKIGVLNTLSGPFATLGEMIDKGYRLYMKVNAESCRPASRSSSWCDDTGGRTPTRRSSSRRSWSCATR